MIPLGMSYYLNMQMMSLSGLMMDYVGMRILFSPRRSKALWWGYFVARAVIQDLFLTVIQLGTVGPGLDVAYAVFSSVTSIVSFIVQCLFWDGEIAKVGISALVVDFFSGFCMLTSVVVCNMLSGRPYEATYQTVLRPDSLSMALGCLVVFAILSRPFLSVARWFQRRELRHPHLWEAVAILAIAFATAVRLTEQKDVTIMMTLLIVCLGITLVAAGVYFSRRMRSARIRKEILLRTRSLLEGYNSAITKQVSSLKANRRLLEQYEQDLNRLTRDSETDRLAEHLRKMRERFDQLRYGHYCNDPTVDAILSVYARRFREEGFDPNFSAAGFRSTGPTSAEVAQLLLSWGYRVCTRGATRNGMVMFSIRIAANQTVYRLTIPVLPGRRFSKRPLQAYCSDGSSTLLEKKENGRYQVLVMLEEGTTWESLSHISYSS